MSLTKNFDKLNKGNADKDNPQNSDTENGIEQFSTPGHVRNLCFVQPDGKRLFLNYAYLVSGEYKPEENIVVLTYTTHEITLKGRSLTDLYNSLMAHMLKQVVAIDKRYEATKETTEPIVFEIAITKV